jgi:hypothetical protein
VQRACSPPTGREGYSLAQQSPSGRRGTREGSSGGSFPNPPPQSHRTFRRTQREWSVRAPRREPPRASEKEC